MQISKIAKLTLQKSKLKWLILLLVLSLLQETLGKTLTKTDVFKSNFKTLLKSFCIHSVIMFMYFPIYFVKKNNKKTIKF